MNVPKSIDISQTSLFRGIVSTIWPFTRRNEIENNIKKYFKTSKPILVTLSVRTGFDLICSYLNKKNTGGEVLMTGITIQNMVDIAKDHHFTVKGIDINPETFQPDLLDINRKVNKKTRAIVIAQLFGSIVDLEPLKEIKKKYPKILIIEDAAQSYNGDYTGSDVADITLFSFGTIKTQTALGGGVMIIDKHELYDQLSIKHQAYPVSSRLSFLMKLIKVSLLKILSLPLIYAIIVKASRGLNINLNQYLYQLTKGFSKNFYKNIRKRPTDPLLRLLSDRLKTKNKEMIQHRQYYGNLVGDTLSQFGTVFEAKATNTSHWLVPFSTKTPDFMDHAYQTGFHWSKNTTQLVCFDPCLKGANTIMKD